MPISSEPAERAEGWLYNAVLYKRFEHLQISVSTGESWNQSSTNIERTTVIKVHDTTPHVGECVYVCVYIYMVCVFIYTSNVYMCLCVHTYTHRCVFVSSVAQSCPTLYDPMNCSMPSFPVHHQLLEPIHTHVHCVSDAIQPPHPLSSPSPPVFNLSWETGYFPMSRFFATGGQSIGISASASVLSTNIQDWFPLGCTGWVSLQSKGLSMSLLQHHSSKASICQCSAFFSPTLPSIHDYWKNHSLD